MASAALFARQVFGGADLLLGREPLDVALDAVEEHAGVGVRLLAAALAVEAEGDRHVARHVVVASVRALPLTALGR
jgi:hypothetical protein